MENQKKHKVVFIHPDLGIGGAERLVLDVAVALAEKGNEVSFVTNHFDKTHAFQELQDGQFPVHVVGDWIPRSVCGICQALCAYLRMIFLALVYVLFIDKEEKPDVYFIDQIPMAVPFIKWAGGKVIYYCHHPDLLASPPGGRLKTIYRMPIDWLELKGTSLADVILVNSKYTASVFRKTFPQITKDIHILYPTISASYQNNIENYNKIKTINELVPEIQVIENQVIFLSINRYHPAKNLELALNGLEALKSKLSPNDWQRVYLIVAGGYDPQSTINAKYFTDLVTIAQEKNLVTKVVFLKSLSDDLKVDLLLACDCLIYTPINEHFGIVPLEAMIAAKPVIACNSGGPCETVENEVTGFLCEPNANSLAAAMSKLLDKNNFTKIGLEGKKRLQKLFSHIIFVNSINNIVETVLDQDKADESLNVGKETNVTEKEDEIPNNDYEHSSGDTNLENTGISRDPVVEDKEKNEDSTSNKDSSSLQKEQPSGDTNLENTGISSNSVVEDKEKNEDTTSNKDSSSPQKEQPSGDTNLENTGIDSDSVAEDKEKVEDSMSNKNSSSSQKEQSSEIEVLNKDKVISSKADKAEESEITKTQEQSPAKVELQNKKLIDEHDIKKSSDKNSISNKAEPNISEIKNELLIEGEIKLSSSKNESKTATTTFLQNETGSNSLPLKNLEHGDEALVQDL